MTSRNPNRASSVYEGGDGFWHGRVTVGYRDDGSIDRRHVMAKSKGVVVQKVRDLERARDQGQVRRPGQRWTVAAWLDHWLENIARPNLRATSYSAYRVAVRRHLIPQIGKHRLDRLEPEHLERLYRKILADGGRPGRAHQVHRTIRTALGEAHRRGHVARNVAALARPPRVQLEPIQPYTVDEVRAIMSAASGASERGPVGDRPCPRSAPGGSARPDLVRRRPGCRLPSHSRDATPAELMHTAAAEPAGRRPAGVRSESRPTEPRGTRSLTRAGGWSGCLRPLASCSRASHRAGTVASRGPSALAGRRLGLHLRGRCAAEPELGLPPLEGAAEGGRCPRRPAPRRPSHGGDCAPGPGRPGAHGDGHHGLVEHGDGGAIPARHGPDPAAGCGPGRRLVVGWRKDQAG